MSDWEEDLPNNCPPLDAKQVSDESFFRLVNQFPTLNKDWYSPKRLDPRRSFKVNEDCQSRALSIFKDIRDCENVKNFKQFRDFKIISVKLKPNNGVVVASPRNGDSHHDWWKYKGNIPTHELVGSGQ